jgi:dipeptidyl aminopeptidase/acylaminoacyl peptidase
VDWEEYASALVGASACWGATLAPDNSSVAYVSDRTGLPRLWVQDTAATESARLITLSDDPVVAVRWSADGHWLACAVATDGGVRTEVWLVRPDGSRPHRVAGGDRHAVLGPWTRTGSGVVVQLPPDAPDEVSRCLLIDADTGATQELAAGGLVNVLDLSADGRYALLRDGTRGAEFCVLLDRTPDDDHAVLPYPHTGSTSAGFLRPGPDGGVVAYLLSDAGLPRRGLVAVPLRSGGYRGEAGVLAARDDGELEHADGDDAGRLLALAWNVAGRSQVELLDCLTGRRRELALPGTVVSDLIMARDGSCVLMTVEAPDHPRRLWLVDTASLVTRPLTPSTVREGLQPVSPELVEFEGEDGLPLSGWLYRPRSATGRGPATIYLHGGPEAQERPGFEPQHQVLVAAGITVLAPNVRGSSGFGRTFLHADDRYGRYAAIADVRACVDLLVGRGIAARGSVAVAGRSYGGYLTLAALVRFPECFAAGVDICGMSDLLTFYRDTEPWIAAAAVSKYGDPGHDRQLLHELSPLPHVDRITAPVLVVHGEHDTNVPLGEALQLVAELRRLGRPVTYLQLDGEGHEYRRATSRLLLLREMVSFLRTLLPEPRDAGIPADVGPTPE